MDIRRRRFTHLLAGAAAIAFAAGPPAAAAHASERAMKLPAPAFDPAALGAPATAVFAGGCFWGVQAVFQHTQGVLKAVSGYAGGQRDTATYGSVSSGRTGHAESVQVTYDPKRISYGRLLQIYFGVAHDPTQLDHQGPDYGSQYRSAIFFADAAQKEIAQRYIAQLEAARIFPGRIVTQVTPLQGFYPAEAYHQDYATRHPDSPYIAMFDLPKLANLKATLPEVWRDAPVLVSAQ